MSLENMKFWHADLTLECRRNHIRGPDFKDFPANESPGPPTGKPPAEVRIFNPLSEILYPLQHILACFLVQSQGYHHISSRRTE